MDGDGEGSTMDKQGQESATVPTARVLTSGQPDTAELGSTSESSESTAGSDSEQSSADGQTLQAEVNGKPRGESATSTVRKVEASLSKTTPRDESPDSSESSDSSDSSESSESGGDAVANGQASSSADSSSDDTSSQDEKEISTADRKELHAKPSALSRKHKKSKAKDTVVDKPSSSESDADPPGPVSGHDAPATTPKKRKKPHSSPTNEVQERSKKARHSSGGAEQAPRSNGKAQNNRPFRRVAADEPVDEKFQSNAYVPYDYADRAHRDLAPTKGKNFTKEKNKKKRGSYRGGAIDVHGKKGIKFDD
ncbi:MAG: hypothetical protein M1815_004694 [Lichina confinis]|nr:MAG: hypothetical protein M1815_004694 [Lichina confinis]